MAARLGPPCCPRDRALTCERTLAGLYHGASATETAPGGSCSPDVAEPLYDHVQRGTPAQLTLEAKSPLLNSSAHP